MKMNRIKCNGLKSISTSSLKDIMGSVKETNHKPTDLYEPRSDLIQNTHSDEVSYSDNISRQIAMYALMNSKTRQNHIRCTDLNKHLDPAQVAKKCELAEEIKSKEINALNKNVEKEIKKSTEQSLSNEAENIQHIADSLIHPKVRTNYIKCSDSQITTNEVVSGLAIESENFVDHEDEGSDNVQLENVDSAASQDSNISIKASPIILDLLKNIKITKDNQLLNILDCISIETSDDGKNSENTSKERTIDTETQE